jgi:dTDP-L-rhamnose 4-epimerase
VVDLAVAVGAGQSMYEIERYTSVDAIGAIQKVVVKRSWSPRRCRSTRKARTDDPAEGVEVAPDPRPDDQLAARDWESRCPSCSSHLEPLPTPETKLLKPASIYAIGKRDHEEMFLVCGRAYRVPVTALRFFNVYGPRQALSNPYAGVAAIFASPAERRCARRLRGWSPSPATSYTSATSLRRSLPQ